MMHRCYTPPEKGIFVYIDLDELEKLEQKDGYLPRDEYPPTLKELARDEEVGRFLFFRFMVISVENDLFE